MRNPALDASLEFLAEFGITPKVEYGGKHIRLRWTHNGEPRAETVPRTTTDPNIRHIKREDIRKILRQDGLIGDGEPAERPKLPRLRITDGRAMVSTLDVAFDFDRRHKDVLRAIDDAIKGCGPEFARPNFRPSKYRDSTGRSLRAFDLTRDGFSLIVMGFTGAKATRWKVRYIEAFNAMEGEVARLTARMSAIEADHAALLELIAEDSPKAKPRFTRPSLYRRQGKSPWRARP